MTRPAKRRSLAVEIIRAALVTVAVAVVVVHAAGAARTTPAPTKCGDIATTHIYAIRAERVGCTTARRVARQWAAQCAGIPTGSCLVTALFYCRYRDSGFEKGAITCTYERDLGVRTSRRLVRFQTGV